MTFWLLRGKHDSFRKDGWTKNQDLDLIWLIMYHDLDSKYSKDTKERGCLSLLSSKQFFSFLISCLISQNSFFLRTFFLWQGRLLWQSFHPLWSLWLGWGWGSRSAWSAQHAHSLPGQHLSSFTSCVMSSVLFKSSTFLSSS